MKKHLNQLLCFTLLTLGAITAVAPMAGAAGKAVTPPEQEWSFNGFRAEWDVEQIFRGYRVATQVCLACHSFKYIKHRDLMKLGFSEEQVRKLADEMGMDGIDQKFISALTDENAKQLYGGPVPDLSLMNLARKGGADYSYALLKGYVDPPEGKEIPMGSYYNKYFPGGVIAMPPPLTFDGQVEYPEGGPEATVEQMARDVTAFMEWTAEPIKVERQNLGFYVLLYLLIFTILAYLLMKAIWRDVKK